MLNASRALTLSHTAGPELPRVPALVGAYQHGLRLRQGQVIMVAGRPGAMKSTFALWLVAQWNLPTLYCSADMSSFTASTKLAGTRLGLTTEEVEATMSTNGPGAQEVRDALNELNIRFCFDSPITWQGLEAELMAYVELENQFPQVIVIDNLMDIEDCATDFTAQQEAMEEIVALARNTGATVIILHHAQENNQTDPSKPPSRGEIHNKMNQKPEVILTVAYNTHANHLRLAVVKSRMGKADPSGDSYTTLVAHPETTRFSPFVLPGNFGHLK